MRILDLSAGNRAVWYDKNNPVATFIDIRPNMKADIVCDSRAIPTEVGKDYDMVVFDPPHVNCGPNSYMAQRYGHFTTAQILDLIQKTGVEAHRVTRSKATMALKWNDHDIKLKRVFDLLPSWEPLFGHLTKDGSTSKSQTYWVMLLRRDGVVPGTKGT